MSDVLPYVGLGFHHIVSPAATDHLLFLVALAAIYRRRDWRRALWVVSAFTAGHSITLALAVTGALALPAALIEFLIPVTIVATGIENIAVRARGDGGRHRRWRPVFAGVFGLVHGAGFANYLRALFLSDVAGPLFGFNVGIELGQVAVLAVLAWMLAGVDVALEPVAGALAFRWRVVGLSAGVALAAATMAFARRPW